MVDSKSKPGGPASPDREVAALATTVVSVAFLCNFLGRGIVGTFMVFMLPVEIEFGWARSTLTGVFAFYLMTVGLMSPGMGKLYDKYGPRNIYLFGMFSLFASMLGAGYATQLWQFYVFIGLLGGIGASALGIVPATALIRGWFDKKLSLAIAVAYAGLGAGILVVVPIVQLLIDAQGWRNAYFYIAFALLGLVPVLLVLPWKKIGLGRPALQLKTETHKSSVVENDPLATGWTIKTAVRTLEFWLMTQVFFFAACGVYSVSVQVVVYLVEQGYPAINASLAFGSTGMLSIVGVIFSGWLCTRIGYRLTATISFCASFVGVAALLLFSTVPMAFLVPVYVVFFGLSQGARGPIVSTFAARIFANGSVASIFGAIFLSASLGGAFGSWISGFLHDATGGYRATFVFSAISILLAGAPFWMSSRLSTGESLPVPNTRGASFQKM